MDLNQATRYALELQQAGRLLDAEKMYRQVLDADPSRADALRMLGLLEHQLGRHDAALDLIERSLRLEPANPAAHNNLANALYALGRAEEAALHYRRTLELRPDIAVTHNNLGKVLTDLGRFEEAEQCFRRALVLNPDYPEANNDLGTLFQRRGAPDEAVRYFRRALELNPRFVEAHSNLANTLKGLGHSAESEKHYRIALDLDPASAVAHVNLGTVLHERGLDEEAGKHFRRAVELKPEYVAAKWAFAMAQLPAIPESCSEAERCRASFALELAMLIDWLDAGHSDEGYMSVGNQRPFYLAYQDANNRALLSQYGQLCARTMQRWQRARGLSIQPAVKGSVIRVGIVSAHVHEHSVWNAIVKGWLKHLDRAKFSLHVFSIDPKQDQETALAKSLASAFHTGSRNPANWARSILDERLDAILYPEIGMDPDTIKLASMRLAPVQAVCWGHPETTGLPTIDYFISAQGLEPADPTKNYTEQLITLPKLGCCIQRSPAEDAVLEFSGIGINLGVPLLICPGTPWKYAPERDGVLVELARKLGRCQFIFFRDAPDGLWRKLQARLERAFSQGNLNFSDYGVFVPWQPRPKFYALLKRAVVCLDTIGFSGFNTAMQAVECGVPIVAWEGRFMRGRLASAIVKQIGLHELVAVSDETYIALAIRLATDAAYRDQIRARMQAHRDLLFDDITPIRALEDFLVSAAKRG